MKMIKNASGKNVVKMSKKDWEEIGKKAGWFKEAWMTEDGRDVVQEEMLWNSIKRVAAEKNISVQLLSEAVHAVNGRLHWTAQPGDRDELMQRAANKLNMTVDQMIGLVDEVLSNPEPRFDPHDDMTGQDLDLAHDPHQEPDTPRPEY